MKDSKDRGKTTMSEKTPRITMDDLGPETTEGRSVPLRFDDERAGGAAIKVVGVGGGGGNALNRMIAAGLSGVEFIAVNTDCQALKKNSSAIKVQIGGKLTRGLGAGGDPEVGRQAALEDTDKLLELLEGADMVFVTAGLGGGTGTGAAPVIAQLASDLEALVVAVVTKPFRFEGRRRGQQADQGLAALREYVDTVIAIPNEKLLHTVDKHTSLQQAFLMADDVLRQAVQGISDLITIAGDINLDFADVRTIMANMGMAIMGTGIADGEHRAVEAAQSAVSSPLLEDTSIQGAHGILMNITGGEDLTLVEVNEAASVIQEHADPDANIIFGTVTDPGMKEKVKVTVIATGFPQSGAPTRRRAASAVLPPRTAESLAASPEPEELAPSHSPVSGDQPTLTPVAPRAAFLRRRGDRDEASEVDDELDLPFQGGGFSPNSQAVRKDDLDVPTFLRKQMD
jgi:cell division protein FtsZ